MGFYPRRIRKKEGESYRAIDSLQVLLRIADEASDLPLRIAPQIASRPSEPHRIEQTSYLSIFVGPTSLTSMTATYILGIGLLGMGLWGINGVMLGAVLGLILSALRFRNRPQ